jgi:hypothetical protein
VTGPTGYTGYTGYTGAASTVTGPTGYTGYTGTAGGGFTSRAKAYRNAAQTLSSGAETKIQINAEVYDGDGEFDPTTNYRFTATSAGYYLVIGVIRWATNLDGVDVMALIYKNGAVYSNVKIMFTNTTYMSIMISDVVYLAATNYVELYGYQSSGADADVYGGGADDTYFTIHRLS